MKQRKGIIGWTDVFLLVIIFLNIFDFFKTVLPSELDYIKKIISWTLLGYILYRASPTKVFFGERHRKLDTAIIISYFLLVFNLLIAYAHNSLIEASLLREFFIFIIQHSLLIEQVTFILGVFILVSIGVFVALRVPFHKRSIMGVLHEEGVPEKKLVERTFMTLLVIFGFFVIVFNMMMQWLAIAVDATILLIALLFWSVFLVRHKLPIHKLLDRVGNVGTNFYEWFIDHFRYKETFLLGVVGLLVLHLLTDAGIFLIPYVTGIKDPIYLSGIVLQYNTIWQVFGLDWLYMGSLWKQLSYVLVFIANIIGYIFLFISPTIIWKSLYHRRHPVLPRWVLITFLTVLPALGLAPLIRISRLKTQFLAGVEVQLQSLQGTPVVLIAGIIIVFFLLVVQLSKQRAWKVRLEQLWVALSVVFFIMYIWKYFVDVIASLQEVVMVSIQAGGYFYFFAIIFFIFQALLIIFYAGGLLVLLYELVHRTSHKKRV